MHPRSRQHSPDGSLVTLQIRAIHPIAIKMSPSVTASPGSFIKTRCPCLPPTHPMGVQTSIDEAAKPAEGWRLQDGWRRARRRAHLCGGRRGGPAALDRATRESRAGTKLRLRRWAPVPALPAGLKAIVLRVGGFRRVRLFQQEELVRETRSLLHVNNMGFIKNQEKKKAWKINKCPHS